MLDQIFPLTGNTNVVRTLYNIQFGRLYQISYWYRSAILILNNSVLHVLHNVPYGNKCLLVGTMIRLSQSCCHCYVSDLEAEGRSLDSLGAFTDER